MYAGSGNELNGDDAGPILALDGDPGAANGCPLAAGWKRRSGDAGAPPLNRGWAGGNVGCWREPVAFDGVGRETFDANGLCSPSLIVAGAVVAGEADPIRNFKGGIFGLLASSSLRLQSAHTK